MAAAAPDKSEAWRTLDVAVLQKLVLEGVLGLDEEKMGNPEYVEYVKDVPNAMNEMIDQSRHRPQADRLFHIPGPDGDN